MPYTDTVLICEAFDEFAWDPEEVRDLIQTTPLRFDEDGMPVGYAAEQLFGLEAHLGGRL